MATTQDIIITLKVVECANCGVSFGMPENWHNHFRKTHQYFYCPAGHNNYYPAKSDEEKLRDELKRKEQELSDRVLENFRIGNELDRATKTAKRVTNKLKKMERRVTNGVCPCCNRTFKDLADHMKTKHPEQIKP